jgi:glycosyltransferase involved in cell wall biosynthesis
LPLLEALAQRGDLDIDVISFKRLYPERIYPAGSQRDATAKSPQIPGVRVSEKLDGVNPLSWITGGRSLRGQVVHAQWWSQPLAPAYLTMLALAKLQARKVVVTMHNVEAHEPSLWKALADRHVVALADHLIVHTEQNAKALAAAFPKARGRITVVPMGPQSVANPRGVHRMSARRELSLPARNRTILFFGNIRPYKGLDVLLGAWSLIREALPEARLLVVGQPWTGSNAVAETLEQARRLPGVEVRAEFVPEDKVEPYFAAADITVFPYKGFEAQSGAAARALAFGRAMVVSDVGGLRELVRDPIAIVPASQPAALAKALISILSDRTLIQKLERDAKSVAREFSWPRIAEATAHLYHEVSGSGEKTSWLAAPTQAG